MRRNATKLLPLSLIVLYFEALLLISGAEARGEQHCRLELPEDQVILQPPTHTGVGVSTAANYSSSSPTSSSRSSTATPTSTPLESFIYGADKVRGVNLFVVSLRACKLSID